MAKNRPTADSCLGRLSNRQVWRLLRGRDETTGGKSARMKLYKSMYHFETIYILNDRTSTWR